MLLHVLLQIRLLRVALAAILTDVSLEVLAFLVLGDVLQERGLIHEALVARVTFVGFVRLMAAGVALQVGQLTEGLVASWVAALVGLVPCVGTDVLLQMR